MSVSIPATPPPLARSSCVLHPFVGMTSPFLPNPGANEAEGFDAKCGAPGKKPGRYELRERGPGRPDRWVSPNIAGVEGGDPDMRFGARGRGLSPSKGSYTALAGHAKPQVTSAIARQQRFRKAGAHTSRGFQAIGVTPAQSTPGSGQMQAQRLRESGRAAASMG